MNTAQTFEAAKRDLRRENRLILNDWAYDFVRGVLNEAVFIELVGLLALANELLDTDGEIDTIEEYFSRMENWCHISDCYSDARNEAGALFLEYLEACE